MIRPGLWRRELTVPLQNLQSELNRLIEGYWQAPGGAPSAAPVDLTPSVWSPAIDLFETPGELILVVDLPGVDPASIDLSLTGSVLSLRGEKASNESANQHERTRERLTGTFQRQVSLPEPVDFDNVQAEARNGVLTVRLPKQVTAKARTIPVQSASA